MHTFVVLAYKESSYLEDCIKSVMNQKYKSKVLIATSTPNEYINKLSKKYNLEVIINDGEKGIGADFDFAIKCGKTKLVTIAHQDDIYDYEYSYKIVEEYKKNPNSIIIFTDYYEIKNSQNVYTNTNLKIKRILLLPIRFYLTSGFKLNKRLILSFGNAISCPTVTFNKQKIIFPVFTNEFKCNVDWDAWERLSKLNGKFSFVSDKLMGHRIHEESTTTEIIRDNIRTKEDYIIFKRFWPKSIANIFCKLYSNSEKNNQL